MGSKEKQQVPGVDISNIMPIISRSKSAAATKLKESDPKGLWAPKKWQEMWNLILEMRKENPAAVDTMGAHTLSDSKFSENE